MSLCEGLSLQSCYELMIVCHRNEFFLKLKTVIFLCSAYRQVATNVKVPYRHQLCCCTVPGGS